ncbi:hypothetical protein ACQJBY_060990 [Aegilops geniculata]
MEGVEEIVIAGAGLAGLATALGLHRKGVRCVVLESSATLRASGYAFTTWTNAFRALDALGVGDKIREHHLLYESGPHEIRCVKRNFLLETLENELPEGTIRYSSKIVAIEEEGNVKLLHMADGSTIRANVLVGCDGVNSVVAKWLGLPKPILSGRSATRGLAEYPDGHGFGPEMLQFIGQGFRSGVLPCSDTSVYWNYTWYPSPADGDAEGSVDKMRQHVLARLRAANKIPAEALDVIERSEMSEVVSSPLRFRSPLALVRGSICRGGVCVAGDAFHPMTPELGQGGCAALEDGVVLARCLGEAFAAGGHGRAEAALEKYAGERRWRAVRLVTAAYVVGFVQQSSNPAIKFLRERFLSGLLARVMVDMADFDCGKL